MQNAKKTSSLQFDGVNKFYLDRAKTTTIVKDLSATFEQGKKYVITGASGTGKTTLLHMLAGFEPPSSGIIRFNNHNIAHMNEETLNEYRQNAVGMVFQLHHLIFELTALENIALAAEIGNHDRAKARASALQCLEYVGLTNHAHDFPTTLSGGERQRVAVARALVNKPSFIIADEPTGNLDEENSKNLINLLEKARTDWNTGLIISTHDALAHTVESQHLHLEAGQLKEVV